MTSHDSSRGEPAFVFRLGDRYLAQVLECLGTKSSVARAVQEQTGANHFAALVAAVVEEGPPRVILEPVGVSYDDAALKLR